MIFDFFMTAKAGGFLSMGECQFQPQEGNTQQWKCRRIIAESYQVSQPSGPWLYRLAINKFDQEMSNLHSSYEIKDDLSYIW